MKIIIGSDHAGYKMKKAIKQYLEKKGIDYEDVGTYDEQSTDYPDYAFKVAEKVAKGSRKKGILICGTGTGMVIAANKKKGIRAALAYDHYSAKKAKEDNNTNVLCLRGRKFPEEKAKRIVGTWLETDFSNLPRHKRRIRKIAQYKNES